MKDTLSNTHRRDDDIVLPVFDPTASDLGAESWCNNLETLSKEFGWSSIATVAKAGKALKGSALLWFETWDPEEGRSWENLRRELTALFPEKKNLVEKLQKAVLYTSDSAISYCEYAREKIRLLRNTKVAFSEIQLVELVCGSITDVNVRMASFNSNVKNTSELIALFTSYVKIKKRLLEQDSRYSKNIFSSNYSKRPKFEGKPNEIRCFVCGKLGHTKTQCPILFTDLQKSKPNIRDHKNYEFVKDFCTFCKKPGHVNAYCRFKPQLNSNNIPASEKEVNFLGNPN